MHPLAKKRRENAKKIQKTLDKPRKMSYNLNEPNGSERVFEKRRAK
jgi:hypothetical protein